MGRATGGHHGMLIGRGVAIRITALAGCGEIGPACVSCDVHVLTGHDKRLSDSAAPCCGGVAGMQYASGWRGVHA